ncbi:MAG: cobyric acid synthase [Propionibacteriaceae bacterium]|nr:cobyric acid synthase [Propionibacteriaceae bacterium]
MPGILIAGTSSDAGKSLVVAGLCRAFADRGVRVAPYKAQNMSNNSMVVVDPGRPGEPGRAGEIGRAQWTQARGARITPTTAMNPVLLKPGSDRRSFVVVRGRPAGTLASGEYATGRQSLAAAAFEAYAELADKFDLVICEGAGSPAEINLRAGDYVNFGLAERFDLPVVVVGDIDRGGILAALFGTWAIVSDADRARLTGYLINKFRGDQRVLDPGLAELTRRTGMRSLGVLPWLDDVWLDGEDTLRVDRWPATTDVAPLTVAVVRFPRVSNATDVDPLAAEPGVEVTVTTSPMAVATADLVILPGSRSTVSDLAWLTETGLAAAIDGRVRAGKPVLGICGGYQMLCREIHDDVESGRGVVAGLGHIDAVVRFKEEKTLGLPRGSWRGHDVGGYLIHHGRIEPGPARQIDGPLHQEGVVWGTLWHGLFEHDEFRRAWLTEIATRVSSPWRPRPGAPGFDQRREAMLDRLAQAINEHVDLDQLLGR